MVARNDGEVFCFGEAVGLKECGASYPIVTGYLWEADDLVALLVALRPKSGTSCALQLTLLFSDTPIVS